MEPLNVSKEDFPMSTACAVGMIPMQPKIDNYELSYYEDVVYIKRGCRNLHLQILRPINAKEDLPCIVYIPGSAFHEQNVKERVPQLSYLAQRGFVVAALEYRGSECAIFPAHALDADLYGPTNFATMNEEPSSQDHRTPDSPEGCEIGNKSILDHPELVKPTVIANYVQKDRELPPILMFHGTNDELVPFGQSCELFDALQNAQKKATFYQVIGAHHGGREFWTKEVLDIEEQFIRSLVTV